MGITSSQVTRQPLPVEGVSQLSSPPAQDQKAAATMNDDNVTPVQTPDTVKSKTGKLKTYGKTKRASAAANSAKKVPAGFTPRITRRMASEELGDERTIAQPVIPPTIEETPVKAKKEKKTRKRKSKDAAPAEDEDTTTADAEAIAAAEAEAIAAAAAEAEAEEARAAEKPAKRSKRRSKKQQLQDEAEAQLQQEVEESQHVQVPVTQEDQPDEPTEDPQEQQGEIAKNQPELEAADEQASAEDDISQFDVPADSDTDIKAQAKPAKQRKVSKKRKRVSEPQEPLTAPTTPDEPSKKKQRRISKSTLDYPNEGPFTTIEADIIEQHFNELCTETDLTREQLIQKIQSASRELSKFYAHIASDVLPNRNRRAIQRYIRRHYNSFQRGRWTDEQDSALRTAYAENPNKWVAIGAKVGRMPEDCRDRWRNHTSLEDRNTDVWTEDEERNLAAAVRECLSALEEKLDISLTRENEDDYIAWPVVVAKINGSRNRLQCSMKWRKMKARVLREEEEQRKKEQAGGGDDSDSAAEQNTRWKQEAKRRFDDMTIGDMYAITKETEYGALMGSFASKSTFWTVVQRLNPYSPWSTADRKLVYKHLKKNTGNMGGFKENIEAQKQWVIGNFDEVALQKRTREELPRKQVRRSMPGSGYRSDYRVKESDDEGAEAADEEQLEGAEEQEDVEMGQGQEEQQQEDEGYQTPVPETNGHAEVPDSPHISESAVDEEEYQ